MRFDSPQRSRLSDELRRLSCYAIPLSSSDQARSGSAVPLARDDLKPHSAASSRTISIGSLGWRSAQLGMARLGGDRTKRICMSTFSPPWVVSPQALPSFWVIPRLPSGDRRIRCLRTSPWLASNGVGILYFSEARQTWFRSSPMLILPLQTLLSWDSGALWTVVN